MDPRYLSAYLVRMANKIDNSNNPDKDWVISDLKFAVASLSRVASEPVDPISININDLKITNANKTLLFTYKVTWFFEHKISSGENWDRFKSNMDDWYDNLEFGCDSGTGYSKAVLTNKVIEAFSAIDPDAKCEVECHIDELGSSVTSTNQGLKLEYPGSIFVSVLLMNPALETPFIEAMGSVINDYARSL